MSAFDFDLDLDHHAFLDVSQEILRQMTQLPLRGTPAAQLTERDKVALAIAAGAPYEIEMDGNTMRCSITRLVGVADRGDGTYIVAIGPELRK